LSQQRQGLQYEGVEYTLQQGEGDKPPAFFGEASGLSVPHLGSNVNMRAGLTNDNTSACSTFLIGNAHSSIDPSMVVQRR